MLRTPVDLYCERLGPGLWAEPVNALTNLAFLAAAAAGWLAGRHRPGGLRAVDRALIVLAALIGIGSVLFHTFAVRWAEWADSGPIWIFVGTYVFAAITSFTPMPPARQWLIGGIVAATVAAVLVLMATGEAAHANAADPLNGSGQYAPALIALAVFAGLARRRRHKMAPWALAAALTFLVSLALRSIDIALCPAWPLGTHFGWHLANGLMVGLLLVGLVRTAPPRPA